jgi:hypothetical protein
MTRTFEITKALRGVWWVEVSIDKGTPEKLFCVHQEYMGYNTSPYYEKYGKDTGSKCFYWVPWKNYSGHGGNFANQIYEIEKCGKVVLTRDAREDISEPFKRNGYVAVFSIADVKVDDDGWGFRIVERIANWRK